MTIVLWWRGAARLSDAARITLVIVQIGVGFVVYAFATLLYICGTGIDCP